MDEHDRYVSLHGMRFHYREWGAESSPPVLLLHGLNSHSWDWDFLAEPLSTTHRVICLDLRGHGETDWADDYAAPRFYEDLDALIEAIALDRPAIFGYSVGGAIAYAYGGTHPERVGRLVVVDNAPERTRSMSPDQMEALRENQSKSGYDSIEQAVSLWRRIDPRGDSVLITRSVEHNLRPRDDGTWGTRDHNVSRSNSGFAPAELYQPPAEERWRLLSQITCPTLIVHAQQSEQFDDEIMQRMVSTLRDGRYVQLANSSHRVHWDNPSELLAAVLPFLRE